MMQINNGAQVLIIGFLVIVTALNVVYVRHQHREGYLALYSEELRRDELDDELSQLLVEENFYGFPHSVEKRSRELLGMRSSLRQDIEFVGLDDDSQSKEIAQSSNHVGGDDGTR